MASKIKTIVVSAVNLTEGGPLTILVECLGFLDRFVQQSPDYHVIALVHKKSLAYFPNIEYVEIEQAKKSWFKRLYFEYIYFYKFSKKVKPYLWFSLHDISPNVVASRKAVYCHNATPFHKLCWHDLRFNYKVFLFTMFYRFIYEINIKKNNYIVVQQDWLRKSFEKQFNIPSKNIIVSYPKREFQEIVVKEDKKIKKIGYCFFYPSFPRPFKNFELLCEAALILEKMGISGFVVYITLNGTENSYARWIYNKYKNVSSIDFVGLLDKLQMENYYLNSDCLIFPSKLETWGLPISEFAVYKKPMIIGDLPYAHETASGSSLTTFFNVQDAQELALKMKALIYGDTSMLSFCPNISCSDPFVLSWEKLFNILLR